MSINKNQQHVMCLRALRGLIDYEPVPLALPRSMWCQPSRCGEWLKRESQEFGTLQHWGSSTPNESEVVQICIVDGAACGQVLVSAFLELHMWRPHYFFLLFTLLIPRAVPHTLQACGHSKLLEGSISILKLLCQSAFGCDCTLNFNGLLLSLICCYTANHCQYLVVFLQCRLYSL